MPVAKNENQLDSEESIAMNIRLLDLMKKTSYRILQINGQRRYGGPPPEWSGPPPPKDSEVFVGKIPRNCFEDELVPVFSKAGKIYELRLMMDFSGTNRGYAFVMYTSTNEAERAVNELNNYEIRPGRNIGVVRSTNNCKIYIGTLAGNVDRKNIKKTIKSLTEGVVDVKIHAVPGSRKRINSRKPHFVIAEYESHRAAAMARRRLLPARLELWGHEVSVEWANTIQKLAANGQVSLQKPCGNRRRPFRDEIHTSRAPSGFCPDDSKLINGRTLEQAMDEMLYGSGGHSPSHSLESTDTNSSLTSESLLSDSDNSFNCPMSEYFFDLEMSDSLAYFNASDERFSEMTIEEVSEYKNLNYLSRSDVLNKNRYNSNIKQYQEEYLLENSLIEKFSQMNVCDQYQLFDNENEYNKETVNNKNNRRILDGSDCYLCSVNCPVIGLIPRRQSLGFRSDSDLIYPLFRYTTDNKEIDIKNI